MSPSEAVAFYRVNAEHCIAIVRHTSDPDAKASLIVRAQAWLELADHTEKYGEITLVYETPWPRKDLQQVARQHQSHSEED